MGKIAFQDSSFVISFHENVLVAITEGDGTLEAVDAWGKQIELGGRAYPSGLALLFIIGDSAVVPSGPVRALATEMFKTMQGTVRVMSTAIEGSGFATATKRAAYTLISQGTIRRIPTKVHGDIDTACSWLEAEAKKAVIPSPSAKDLAAFTKGLPRPSA